MESKRTAMPLERATPVLLCAGALLACSGEAATRAPDGGSITIPADASSNVQADAIVVHVDGAVGDGECRRDVSLTAVTLGEPEPFDLVVVADHSGSLAWSRDELSNGLRGLLSDVQGRSVRVFLLTPTQYGASSAAAQMPLTGNDVVAWRDPATGQAYTNAMTDFVASCTDPMNQPITCPNSKGPTPYRIRGTWQFAMPKPIAEINPQMTDAQFAAQQKAVADAILAIGGTGSPQELPLCTLSRYVSQTRASLPANVVFLVISDEDDIGKPADCLAGFGGSLDAVKSEQTTPCTSNCDAYRYTMTSDSDWRTFALTCAAFDDVGSRIPGTDKSTQVNQAVPSCSGIVGGPCTAAESAEAARFCAQGLKAVSCNRSCQDGSTTCSIDLPNASVDACTQAFTKDGMRYDNLAQYCAARGGTWRDCTSGGIHVMTSTSLQGGSSPMPLMSGSTTADVGTYFVSHADSNFGAGHYLIETIVLDPAFSCKLGPGQSYATNLAKVAGDRSHVFPLCQPYAPALNGAFGFAQSLIQTQFSIMLANDEHVTAVVVVGKDGTERKLAAGLFRYDASTHTLTVERSALMATDSTLRVEITSDCRPIVR